MSLTQSRMSGNGPDRGRAGGGAPWPLALAGALLLTRGAVLALSPREGLIEPVPVDVGDYLHDDDIARAQRFARPQLALHAAGALVQALTLAALVRRPPRRLPAATAGVALSATVGLASLPLRAQARRRALAAGLATQSWSGWGRDVAKSTALAGALSGAAATVAVGLMRRRPETWWMPGSAIGVAAATTLTFLAPVVVDPLFNRFTALPAGPVREDVLALADQAGVAVREVYVVDASQRTKAANAYVTGLGATKRVVLFDTLLDELTREEMRLVVAHELAHVRHRDVARGLATLALSAPGCTYAAARLARALERYPNEPAGAHSLPALALAFGVVGALTGVISSALSRRMEARADAFSLRSTGAPQAFIAFEQKVVRQNLLDPDPPRWLVRALASHPPFAERVGTAVAYSSSSALEPPYSGRFLMPSRVRHLE